MPTCDQPLRKFKGPCARPPFGSRKMLMDVENVHSTNFPLKNWRLHPKLRTGCALGSGPLQTLHASPMRAKVIIRLTAHCWPPPGTPPAAGCAPRARVQCEQVGVATDDHADGEREP